VTLAEFKSLFANGLDKQNAGLVQLLGLCPLLAISNNVVNALSLGLATTLVMAASSGAVSAVRNFVPHEIRIPVFVLIIAALVTVIDLAMNAFVHPLYLVLGIFIPLITTNCIVLARADAFAAKNRPAEGVIDALAMGLGLTSVLVVLGGLRELVGQGTLFAGLDLVFGETAKAFTLRLADDYQGFLLAVLPPGAFVALGLLIAAHNWRIARAEARARTTKAAPATA
jgi:electron transport complex protein RnfE